MPKRIFFFSDIDDTLIQTKRKTDFSKNTVVGAYNREGEAHSFFYEGTKIFIDSIMNAGINFIPTTARNLGSYKRTIFYTNNKINYAILNFGGLILNHNIPDIEWENIMSKKYDNIPQMDIIFSKVSLALEERNLDLEIKIIDTYYISIYNRNNLDVENILIKTRKVLNSFILENDQFYLYQNDNSFGILPNFLNKKFAVEYLMKKHLPILTIGAGDNISDLDFMKLADFKLLPEKYIF